MQQQCNWQYAVNLYKKANTNTLRKRAAIQHTQYEHSLITVHGKQAKFGLKKIKIILILSFRIMRNLNIPIKLKQLAGMHVHLDIFMYLIELSYHKWGSKESIKIKSTSTTSSTTSSTTTTATTTTSTTNDDNNNKNNSNNVNYVFSFNQQ